MSQAPSHISTGGQGSLRPDDSISQVITPYFDQTFGYDLESHNDESTASDILSSAPSDLLTITIGDASGITTQNYSGQAGTASASITSDILPPVFATVWGPWRPHGETAKKTGPDRTTIFTPSRPGTF